MNPADTQPPAETRTPVLQSAALAVLVLTLWRVAWGLWDATELSTDEAQYWLWGQSFALGAYSKPPMIGWLIGASTEMLGQTVFAVRVLAPLLHALTAVLILALAARLVAPAAAALAAVSYATMPAVTLGSALMTTDTPLLACVAGALLLQHVIAAQRAAGGEGPALPLLLGLAIGLGMLSKYAMLYAVAGMAAAAALSPAWRIGWQAAALAAGMALLVFAPNVWWVAQHGFITAQHLVDDAEYAGIALDIVGTARFLAEQFAVMGPILFAAWLFGLRRLWGRGGLAGLTLASLLPMLIVLGQALTSRVLANWAVAFTVAGVIAAADILVRRQRLAVLSLVLGTILALGVPLARVYGTGWTLPGGKLVFARYLGHAELTDWAMEVAAQHGVRTLLADSRGLLADLSWAAAETDIDVRALPHSGAPSNHWELVFPFDPGRDPMPAAILVREDSEKGDLCADAAHVTQRRRAGPGHLQGHRLVLHIIDSPACLRAADPQG